MASSTQALKAVAAGEKQANPVAVFRNFLERQKSQLQMALPKHLSADRMIRLAVTEFAKNPTLQKCSEVSVYGSIIQASQLGLEIGVQGQAYLVPYWHSKKKCYEAQLIPGYKGLIALARRSGDVTSIESHIVYENDEFELTLGINTTVRHVPRLDGDRGRMRLVYAVAHFKDGGHHFEWMSIADVELIRSRSKAAEGGPWVTDYGQMVRKTVIRRMCNYLPMSIELQTALTLDDAAAAGQRATIEGDFVVVDDEAGNGQPPAQDHDDDAPRVTYAQLVDTMQNATHVDQLAEAATLIETLPENQRESAAAHYRTHYTRLTTKE